MFRDHLLQSKSTSKAISVFMANVYMWMMVGVTISGITAYLVASNPNLTLLVLQNKTIFYSLLIFQVLTVIALSAWVQRMSVLVASMLYALYATLVGVTLSAIFLTYTMQSISTAFFITAFSFGGLSLYAYTTKRDLSPVGSFCLIGLFGILGTVLVSLIFPSLMNDTMQLLISAVSIIVFAGLTTYDTQRIKSLSLQYHSSIQARKGAIHGALILYLDFINLFINLLRFIGDRR
jgi:uncharacterized protein